MWQYRMEGEDKLWVMVFPFHDHELLVLIDPASLRLASHLYSEHLLDQDHYLDWLITSFESSDLDHLPIWLLVEQFHQQEILQHRQRGRRLAGAVLEHLCVVSNVSETLISQSRI